MYSLLFKNRVAAMGFVLLTAAGAISIVGTEEEGGLIEQTKEQFGVQKQEFADRVQDMQSSARKASPRPARDSQQMPLELADDEHLIDTAEGYDPTPDDAQEPGTSAELDEKIIILESPEGVEPGIE